MDFNSTPSHVAYLCDMHVLVWTSTVLRHMLPTSVICMFSYGLQQYSVTCCLPLWYACSRMDFNSTPSHVAYLCDMHVLVWTGTVLRHMLPTSVICMFSYGLRPYSVTCCLPLWYACSRMDCDRTSSHVAYLCNMHVLVWTSTVLRHMLPTSVICMFSYGLRPYFVTCCLPL